MAALDFVAISIVFGFSNWLTTDATDSYVISLVDSSLDEFDIFVSSLYLGELQQQVSISSEPHLVQPRPIS